MIEHHGKHGHDHQSGRHGQHHHHHHHHVSTNILVDPVYACGALFDKEEHQHFYEESLHAAQERELLRNHPEATGLTAILLDIIPACVICANAIMMGLQADIA